MTGAVEIIHALVAPVVIISANGLLCLALYNRLAAVVGRLRVFYREHVETYARFSEMASDEQNSEPGRKLRERLTALNGQYSGIYRRARLLRNALILLLSAVLALLLCTVVLGASQIVAGLESWSLAPFFAGVLATAGGVVLAIRELAVALDPVKAERKTLPMP